MVLNKKTYIISFPTLNKSIKAEYGDNLLSLIQMANIPIAADCGGVGKCGKCVVEVNGVKKLACKTHVTEDFEVVIPNQIDTAFEILSDFSDSHIDTFSAPTADTEAINRFVVAIDIGTTTVVIKLISAADASEIASDAFLNPQVKYGSDVISRINNSMDDSALLSSLICERIDTSIAKLTLENGIDASNVERMVIAGNTAMSYILLGLPCRSIGVAPFEPKYKLETSYEYSKIFHNQTLDCPCHVLPYMSSYVGGDITSGIISLSNFDDFLLIDMGTNGELAYKASERLICTSTAAGPAFEGVNISCGIGSTEGAISRIWIENAEFKFETIGAASPIGICGSGILDLMACLVKEEIIDETGAFEEDSEFLSEDGIILAQNSNTGDNIVFTQKDVREFQLAKSAVRSGIEVLIEERDGILPDKVFLAGGFGQKMNPVSAFEVGLLPPSLKDKVLTAGNTSLAGAIKIALKPDLLKDANLISNSCEEINLATHPKFNDFFMDYLAFDE